ncbi:Protein CASC1 [Araneus ventricosus]|uniref:Protein CASC1 n=1 Tax=Araneus ventricosus TaxID=182803 RepID=A0A4Y2FS19_ARAVE|nr:Protein CASC1 [Araneus ventricosus]
MPPKKKLDKKALLKKKEEERLRQEELARQEQERIRLLEEEERLRKEEEARIKAEEDQKRGEQEADISDYIRRVFSLSSHKRVKDWEQKRWNDYIHKTKEMDSLKLPIVNAFISEWEDDPSYEIESIVQTSHRCLQIVDDITSAIFTCPEVYAKTRLWKEGIVNLKKAIGRKLDYASFMLLKDAYLHLDAKSQNMEFGFSEGQITLCLWANIHRAVRRHGMERNGFRFWIPPHLAAEDCVVRILRLSFPPALDLLSLAKEDEEQEEDVMAEGQFKSNELIQENKEIVLEDIPSEETLNAENAVNLENEGEKTVANNPGKEAAENTNPTTTEQKSDAKVSPEVTFTPSGGEQAAENGEKSDGDDKYSLDATYAIPSEPKEKLLDLNEYFLVGGLLHFDFLEVPKLTVRKNDLTYIYREEPKLKPKKCEPKPFHPFLTLPEDLSSEKEVQTKKTQETRQDESADSDSEESIQTVSETIKESIVLRAPLPRNVALMDVPQPALFRPEENAFSTEGIALEDYDEEENTITFETDQFGIFGLFQKLYYNFPYKSWRLNGGKIAELSLVGEFLSLRIAISEEGCRLESIKPGKLVDSELPGTASVVWMTPEQLIQKLLKDGINIAYGTKASKFIGISQKKTKLEEGVYNNIALLSKDYDFSWSKWNRKLPSGGIALNYRHVSERKKVKYNLVLIRRERTVKLKQEEEMETFSNEPADSQEFSGTLFHLVQGSSPETLQEIAGRSGWIQNVDHPKLTAGSCDPPTPTPPFKTGPPLTPPHVFKTIPLIPTLIPSPPRVIFAFRREHFHASKDRISLLWPNGNDGNPTMLDFQTLPLSISIIIGFSHCRRGLACCIPKKVERPSGECPALDLNECKRNNHFGTLFVCETYY